MFECSSYKDNTKGWESSGEDGGEEGERSLTSHSKLEPLEDPKKQKNTWKTVLPLMEGKVPIAVLKSNIWRSCLGSPPNKNHQDFQVWICPRWSEDKGLVSHLHQISLRKQFQLCSKNPFSCSSFQWRWQPWTRRNASRSKDEDEEYWRWHGNASWTKLP